MARIPSTINNVSIEFGSAVNREVSPEMISALKYSISSNVATESRLEKIWISSAADQHRCPSRHVTGNAVDISRINGKKIILSYSSDEKIKAIVVELQKRFEKAPSRRENFGPHLKKKNGTDYPVSGHDDHIHWSVNGDHTDCSESLIDRLKEIFRKILRTPTSPTGQRPDEVCDI